MNFSRNVQTYLQLRNKLHKLIDMGTHLPITRTAQSVFDTVSNIFRLHLNYLFTLTSPLLLPVKIKMSAAVSVPLSAWLSPVRSAAGNKLKLEGSCSVIIRCNLSAWLQLVSSAAICQGSCNFKTQLNCRLSVWLQQFQPSSPCQLSCTRSERLQTRSSASNCTGPAVFCQLIGNLSALFYSVTQCCSALFSCSYSQSGKLRCWGRCQVQ